MSTYFKIRHPLTVTVGEQTHDFYVRELGYIEFQELKRKTQAQIAQGSEKDRSGIELMTATVLACVEEEDGSRSYTDDGLRTEIPAVLMQLGKAALKAQGIDVDKPSDDEPMTEEEVEGNAEPSRMSGASSPSTSAAPLAN